MPTATISQQHRKERKTAINPAIKERNARLVLLSRRTIDISNMQIHKKYTTYSMLNENSLKTLSMNITNQREYINFLLIRLSYIK